VRWIYHRNGGDPYARIHQRRGPKRRPLPAGAFGLSPASSVTAQGDFIGYERTTPRYHRGR
jgi:hypothetical protein